MSKVPLRFQKSRTAWHTMSRLERTYETCGAEAPRKEQERETTKSENKRDNPSKSSRVENGRLSGSRRVSPTVPNPPSTQVGAVTSRAPSDGKCENVRGSYSARVPRSSLARVHREFVHHILEDEVDGQEEGQDDKREDGEQREESGVVEESQNKHMSA